MPAGRRPGPGDTRADVLRAARTLFAEGGYRATTVRAIAERAGVNPAMIHHFFGSKHEVFVAAVRMPLDPQAVLGAVLAGPAAGFPRRLVEAFVGYWSADETGPALRTMLRSAVTDEEHAAAIRGFIAAVLLPTAASALDVPAERVATAFSLMLGMALARHVLQVPQLAELADAEIVRRYVPAVRAALRG